MMRETKGTRLLTGYRGQPALDIKAIQEILLRVLHLDEAMPEIIELYLNLIFALPDAKGCRIGVRPAVSQLTI